MTRCHPIHVHHHLWSVYSSKDSEDSLSCQTDDSTVEISDRYVAAQVRFWGEVTVGFSNFFVHILPRPTFLLSHSAA